MKLPERLGVAAISLLLAACAATPARAPAVRAPVYSVYKDMILELDPDTLLARTAVSGVPAPLAGTLPTGARAVALAFATGECGDETWQGVDAARFSAANVPALVAAGVDYVISTGGAKGSFSCASDEGMERFIGRYASPRLRGLDFDIETDQSRDLVAALVARIAAAQRRHPGLRVSFTLATWAASDGSRASLNPLGETVVGALREAGLRDYYVNLMVMDFGTASPAVCVLANGVCDMGRSAEQAVRNVHERYGIALDHLGVTPMIGVNDVTSNVFTLDDARRVGRFVRDNGLAGLHFWSLDRDVRCGPGRPVPSSHCHHLDAPPLAFTRTFAEALQ
jgi:hypothetical protein